MSDTWKMVELKNIFTKNLSPLKVKRKYFYYFLFLKRVKVPKATFYIIIIVREFIL